MIAALVLGFDDQRPALRGDFRAKARSGDSPADNDHIELAHLLAGYEFETCAV
jgi:hypothetical protein